VVRSASGESVARVRSAADGSFSVTVVAGRYELVPQPVEGLLGTAASVEVIVAKDIPGEPIQISYDSGIR